MKAKVIASTIIAFVVLFAVLAPFLCSLSNNDFSTYHTELLLSNGLPKIGFSVDHWFGLEPLTGRDLFSIVAFGAQTSLIVALGATAIAFTLGVGIGIFAGFFGGLIDSLLSKVTDFILLFPGLIFIIALSSVVPENFPRTLLMVLVIGFFGWGGIARVVRSETMKLKSAEFVQFSLLIGASKIIVIFKHILPNIISTLVIFATISLPSQIAAEAGLSFLGVGVQPPTPSWGRTISDAVTWINSDPSYLFFPSFFLVAITLAFNVLGNALRDSLDHSLKV